MNARELYLSLARECVKIADLSLIDENMPFIANNASAIDDYAAWYKVISKRPEEIMVKSALREYQMSLLANLTGLYNLAFTGLRFFFERTLTSILFSTREIDLRIWMKGGRDTYWSEICDDDRGIFSINFCKAFFPELLDEVKHYKTLAIKVYRECSEYVHGNIAAQSKMPNSLTYNAALVSEWHEKADTIRSVIVFAFCLRYLPYLSSDERNSVETCVLDQCSHIESIRLYFSNIN